MIVSSVKLYLQPPYQKLTRITLSQRGRIGKGHDDRPVNVRCHLLDDFLIESPCVGRRADQDGGLNISND